jgi:uncharacterized membrane protein
MKLSFSKFLLIFSLFIQFYTTQNLKIAKLIIQKTTKNSLKSMKLKINSSEVIQGVGDNGCALPSPSRINTLSLPIQFTVFSSVFLALFVGTNVILSLINFGRLYFPGIVNPWISTWYLLGPIYSIAGIAHFTICDEFCNIMPAAGSWGIWYVLGSKRFHVLWTGVAEIIGGLLLTLDWLSKNFGIKLPEVLGSLTSNAALGLLILTILVTPANIYMYTHGAKLPMNGPAIPVTAHYIRLALQAVLFAQFYILAQPALSSLFPI